MISNFSRKKKSLEFYTCLSLIKYRQNNDTNGCKRTCVIKLFKEISQPNKWEYIKDNVDSRKMCDIEIGNTV